MIDLVRPEKALKQIEDGADVCDMDDDGNTALMEIAKMTDLDEEESQKWIQVARRLLEAGLDPNMQDSKGRCALHFAAVSSYTGLINFLLHEVPTCDANVKATDRSYQDQTPLHFAACEGKRKSLESFLVLGQDRPNPPDPMVQDAKGFTPLHTLVSCKKGMAVRNIDLFFNTVGDDQQMEEQRKMQREMVNLASAEYLSCTGLTPLHLAVSMGHHDLILPLTKNGANVFVRAHYSVPMGMNPLHEAVRRSRKNCIGPLLEHCGDSDALLKAPNDEGETSLVVGIRCGSSCLMDLVSAGAATSVDWLNATDIRGKSALDYCDDDAQFSALAATLRDTHHAIAAMKQNRERAATVRESDRQREMDSLREQLKAAQNQIKDGHAKEIADHHAAIQQYQDQIGRLQQQHDSSEEGKILVMKELEEIRAVLARQAALVPQRSVSELATGRINLDENSSNTDGEMNGVDTLTRIPVSVCRRSKPGLDEKSRHEFERLMKDELEILEKQPECKFLLRPIGHTPVVAGNGRYQAEIVFEAYDPRSFIATDHNLKLRVRHILEALAALHNAGIYHRNLSSRNILLMADGSIRLRDVLRMTAPDSNRDYYTAPEVFSSRDVSKSFGAGRDLWALGIVILEILLPNREAMPNGANVWAFKKLPMVGFKKFMQRDATKDNFSPEIPDIEDQDMKALLKKLLSWDSAERGTAQELLDRFFPTTTTSTTTQ